MRYKEEERGDAHAGAKRCAKHHNSSGRPPPPPHVPPPSLASRSRSCRRRPRRTCCGCLHERGGGFDGRKSDGFRRRFSARAFERRRRGSCSQATHAHMQSSRLPALFPPVSPLIPHPIPPPPLGSHRQEEDRRDRERHVGRLVAVRHRVEDCPARRKKKRGGERKDERATASVAVENAAASRR